MSKPQAPALACLALFLAGAAWADSSHQATGRNPKDMAFAATPGLPDCARNAVVSGDPTKGSSVILGRISAGCTVPWHWHSPTEQLMLVSGSATVETRGGKPIVLEPGGFAELPPRHVHQFRCEAQCLMYVHADGPFDIHYVDGEGREIGAAAALEAHNAASAR